MGNLSLFRVDDIQTRLPLAGVYIFKSSEAPGYPTGHFTNAAFLIEGAIVVLVLRAIYKHRNKTLPEHEKLWQL